MSRSDFEPIGGHEGLLEEEMTVPFIAVEIKWYEDNQIWAQISWRPHIHDTWSKNGQPMLDE